MPNTSATGGILTPDSVPVILEDEPLIDFIQEWIVALTGLATYLVRPRWQSESSNITEEGVTWMAFGITKRKDDPFNSEVQSPNGNGSTEMRRHEVLTFLISCYGPLADSKLSRFKDGVQVSQNREVLSANNMGLVAIGEKTTVIPELIKDRWLYRVDLPFEIQRQVVRSYSVMNIIAAPIVLDNEQYTSDITFDPGLLDSTFKLDQSKTL